MEFQASARPAKKSASSASSSKECSFSLSLPKTTSAFRPPTATKLAVSRSSTTRPMKIPSVTIRNNNSDITPPETKYLYRPPTCNAIWEFDPFIYRYNETNNESTSIIFQDVCAKRGWKKYGREDERMIGGSATSWNLWWRFTQTSINPNKSLYSWQYTNHIPKAIGFGNKSYLAYYLNGLKKAFGDIYNFVPATFILPQQYEDLCNEHQRRSKLEFSNHENIAEPAQNLVPKTALNGFSEHGMQQSPPSSANNGFVPVWIIKPFGKSQGKGIFVINSLEGLDFMADNDDGSYNVLANVVVQEYISRPLLIAGFKFDLRLYVCIPSVSPLTIYIYREGLTRFATEKYNVEDLGNCFSHLTNASLNKTGPGYEEDKEKVGKGCKWSLSQLRACLKEMGHSDWYLWQRIVSIIILSLIGESHKWVSLPYTRNCFEFLGYDILIDEHLRPWLLEVNLCPGLNADCPVDYKIKTPMLNDLFNLIGLPDGSKPRPKKTERLFPEYDQMGIPPKYMPTPLSYIHPSEITKALGLIKPKNREKFENNSTLKRRLVDMSSIYTKSLIPASMAAVQNKNNKKTSKPKKNISPSDENNNSYDFGSSGGGLILENGDVINPHKEERKPSSTEANGLSYRCWNDPVAKCGDFIRVFPFDRVSYSMSRGKFRPIDVASLSEHIASHVRNARLLAHRVRGRKFTDSQINKVLKEVNQLNSEVWLPRCASEVPTSENLTVAAAGINIKVADSAVQTDEPTVIHIDSSTLVDESDCPEMLTKSSEQVSSKDDNGNYVDIVTKDGACVPTTTAAEILPDEGDTALLKLLQEVAHHIASEEITERQVALESSISEVASMTTPASTIGHKTDAMEKVPIDKICSSFAEIIIDSVELSDFVVTSELDEVNNNEKANGDSSDQNFSEVCTQPEPELDVKVKFHELISTEEKQIRVGEEQQNSGEEFSGRSAIITSPAESHSDILDLRNSTEFSQDSQELSLSSSDLSPNKEFEAKEAATEFLNSCLSAVYALDECKPVNEGFLDESDSGSTNEGFLEESLPESTNEEFLEELVSGSTNEEFLEKLVSESTNEKFVEESVISEPELETEIKPTMLSEPVSTSSLVSEDSSRCSFPTL